MNLLDIGKKILGLGLPILGSVLGGPAGGAVAGLVSHALGLGGNTDPQKIAAAINGNPQQAKLALQKLENDHAHDLAQLQALQVQATQTNQTMRVEYGSSDAYVRRWRPTWGYVSSAAWLIEALAVVTATVLATVMALQGHTDGAKVVFSGLSAMLYALLGLWTVALSVLGVSIRARSRDKALQAGKAPGPGLLGQLIQRLGGSGGQENAKLIEPASVAQEATAGAN